MIIKLVRDNVAYYIHEDVMQEVFNNPAPYSTNNLMTMSDIAIDLKSQKVQKNRTSVEAVFDHYIEYLNKVDRETSNKYVLPAEEVA